MACGRFDRLVCNQNRETGTRLVFPEPGNRDAISFPWSLNRKRHAISSPGWAGNRAGNRDAISIGVGCEAVDGNRKVANRSEAHMVSGEGSLLLCSSHSLDSQPWRMPTGSDPRSDRRFREYVQVRRVRRRDGDGIARLAGERRLAGKDGIGIESVGPRRGDAQLRGARRPMELELWLRSFSRPFRDRSLGRTRCSVVSPC